MSTTKSCKESRNFWTNSWRSLAIFIIAVICIFLRTLFATEREVEVSKELSNRPVVLINDKTVVPTMNRDTVKLTFTKYNIDTVLVKEDNIVIDTLTKKP